jgi:hypothetical protein
MMAGRWKRKAQEQAQEIESLRAQIDHQQAYERTLRELLEIAKKECAAARAWAERAEAATALADGDVCG